MSWPNFEAGESCFDPAGLGSKASALRQTKSKDKRHRSALTTWVGAGSKATSASGGTKPAEPPKEWIDRFKGQFKLDDAYVAQTLRPGASGAAAIYSSEGVQQTAMIRSVAIRFYTFLNYVLPDG
ncbi:hypothetical protein [uncultured Roseibium sp.]|uniref:hypothetical protein n=1 Tax=uncultured Roseibium sp. TaxID=1936171 RepID=UPI002597B678|nr:hypothetical protein [uncultured Roseibium sp.]